MMLTWAIEGKRQQATAFSHLVTYSCIRASRTLKWVSFVARQGSGWLVHFKFHGPLLARQILGAELRNRRGMIHWSGPEGIASVRARMVRWKHPGGRGVARTEMAMAFLRVEASQKASGQN